MYQQWLAWPCSANRHSVKSFDGEASLFLSRFARCRPIYPATKKKGANTVNTTSNGYMCNRDTNRARPVLFEILTRVKLLSVSMFERRPSNENFEKGHSKSPDIRFTSIMWEPTSAFRRKILKGSIKDAVEHV
jgi:hypothetical protein